MFKLHFAETQESASLNIFYTQTLTRSRPFSLPLTAERRMPQHQCYLVKTLSRQPLAEQGI